MSGHACPPLECRLVLLHQLLAMGVTRDSPQRVVEGFHFIVIVESLIESIVVGSESVCLPSKVLAENVNRAPARLQQKEFVLQKNSPGVYAACGYRKCYPAQMPLKQRPSRS
jgi:hypothetical protein